MLRWVVFDLWWVAIINRSGNTVVLGSSRGNEDEVGLEQIKDGHGSLKGIPTSMTTGAWRK